MRIYRTVDSDQLSQILKPAVLHQGLVFQICSEVYGLAQKCVGRKAIVHQLELGLLNPPIIAP